MPCCCYLFNKSIRSESNWNHPFILHISVYWVPVYRKTAAPPQSPPAIGNLCLNPFTSYGALLLEETDTLTPLQAQWTCISWISWDGICAFTRFKSFQVNLMCCQVRGAQKACLGFLFLNFSIFSIIIAIRVGALLIEREKNSVKEILFQNTGDSIWHWRWGNNPPAFFCPEQGMRALISRGPFRLGISQRLNMG